MYFMDNVTLRLIYVVTDLIAPLIVGYYLHQRHIISDTSINKVITFNVRVIFTVLAILSFWVLPLSWGLLFVPLFGFLLVLFPGATGYLLFARHIENYLDRGAYIASAMLANLGTLGGVCAFILYNEIGFAYSQIIGTCQNILLCLAVFPMAQYCYRKHTNALAKSSRSISLREMFLTWNQISLVGMAVGFALNAAGVPRPAFLGPIFQSLVHISAWIAMLPIGFMIDFHEVRRYFRATLSLDFLRYIVTPVFILTLSYLLIDDPTFSGTLLILSFCPTAINAVLASRIYHLNVDLAVSSFVTTTAAYLLLIFPVIFFILR